MRVSQRLHVGTLFCLEERVVPSSLIQPHGEGPADVGSNAPSAPQDPPILQHFGLEAEQLASGKPVYERWTTTFDDGSTQTDNETFVLDSATDTVTVTHDITLPGTEGSEVAVDHYRAAEGGLTVDHSTVWVNYVLFQNTVTEPNGQTETETRIDAFRGNQEYQTGSWLRPDGVTVNFTTRTVNQGPVSHVAGSYHESNGVSYQIDNLAVSHGPWESTDTSTTRGPDGSMQVEKSTSSGALLASPPA